MSDRPEVDWTTVPYRGLGDRTRPEPVDLATVVAGLPDGLRDRLAERADRLGYINGFLAVGLHHPGAVLALLDMTEQLKAALDPEHVLIVALATHQALGNEYERAQYLDVARAHGMSEAWIGAAQGRAVGGLTAAEEAVRRLTLAVVFAAPPTPALTAAGAHLDDRGLVAIIHLAARFVATSRISHALSLRPMTGPSPTAHDDPRGTAAAPAE
ncbi:hypothetical protein GTZ78_05090 [Streptomyces sp. SID8361]|uniref:carboxymuconolactone decarboxylase family protein n=1 Tax=Streptomyces TaxID=1883 RepID=UPI00081D7393|nr:hypothetical protein [Streptomyces sp. MnatMP-M27]MCC4317405.1 hypothetical protein [Streptomyces malaysiensis]MYU10080.1 hypothetical protein [Streptomyces sp. SID8361]SCF68144.1 hypothetical protein GA0115260_1011110 [Streptomyces sp. MnatMP-M27]